MYVLHLDLGRNMRGGQWQVFYLARYQAAEAKYTPVVACPHNSPLLTKLQEIGVETISLPGSKQWNPISLLKLIWAQRKKKFSIIHTHDARGAALGAYCRKLWGSKVKLVHTRRVSYAVKASSLGKYKLADAVVGVSRDTADNLNQCGLDNNQLCVIHSGIDLSRYTPKVPNGNDRFVFAVVGALTPQKGHSVLIKAMGQLKHKQGLPPWEVRVIGDGQLFDEILNTAIELGVDSHLALLGRQDASKILPSCDCMVVPSVDGEGSSGTIKEAWAVELPLICSSLPANLELAQNNINALVFITGEEQDLAACMERVIRDEELRKALVSEGKKSVAGYTSDIMAAAYTKLYDRLLSF